MSVDVYQQIYFNQYINQQLQRDLCYICK